MAINRTVYKCSGPPLRPDQTIEFSTSKANGIYNVTVSLYPGDDTNAERATYSLGDGSEAEVNLTIQARKLQGTLKRIGKAVRFTGRTHRVHANTMWLEPGIVAAFD